MISVVAQNGDKLGSMSFAEAQQMALLNRLSLVRLGDSSVFKLVDLGKQKYLQKKARSKQRLATRVVRKHIEIRSNIDDHDLDIKFNSISRFLDNKYRVSVMVRFLRLVTARSAYEAFVDSVKDRILQLTACFEGPVPTDTGDNVFYLYGDDPQAKEIQIKNQVSLQKEI
ncbi:translation initiation factor IF-3 [Candidatus Hodgkinia cicadicola]